MADKAKVKVRLRAKLKADNINFPDVKLDVYADTIAKGLTTEDEAEIDTAVDQFYLITPWKDLMVDYDKIQTAEKKKPAKKPEERTDEPTEEEPTTELGKLTKLVTSLSTQVTTLLQEKATASINDQFKAALKEAGLSEKLAKRFTPKTAEEIPELINEFKADGLGVTVETTTEENANLLPGLRSTVLHKPEAASGGSTGVVSKGTVSNWAKSRQPEPAKQN